MSVFEVNVEGKATAPSHAPYLRPVGNGELLAKFQAYRFLLLRLTCVHAGNEKYGYFSQRKLRMTCSEVPYEYF